jgi:uncharacterized protein YceH (UPF0502 family)
LNVQAGAREETAGQPSDERVAQLESTVAELQREVAALREKIESLFG